MQKELRHRLPDDVTTTEDDAVLASRLNLIAAQELNDSLWGSRDEAGKSDAHTPNIDWVEAIDILLWADRFDDALLIDVLGEGKLDDESVNFGIAVEAVDFAEELLFGDILFEADKRRAEAYLGTSLNLGSYISFAAAIVTDKDGY